LLRVAPGRISLVTDAVAGAGLGDGAYRLGDVDIDVSNGVVRSWSSCSQRRRERLERQTDLRSSIG